MIAKHFSKHFVILYLRKKLNVVASTDDIFITYNQPFVHIKNIADQFNRTKLVYFNQIDYFANKIQLN